MKAETTLNGTGVLVVHLQADFTELHQGTLAVPASDAAYVEFVRKATRKFKERGLTIYATMDWHPADHVSFYTQHPGKKPFDVIEIDGRTQVLWPPHCVQDTPGAEFLIPEEWIDKLVKTSTDSRYDSYSGFIDDGGQETELETIFRNDGVRELLVYGIATDYCVRHTVLDALKRGFRIRLLLDLCRGVAEDTTRAAVTEMEQQGAVVEFFGTPATA